MSVEIKVDVGGIPELQRKLAELDDKLRANVDEALSREVSKMQTLAQSLAPKRSGYLASTVLAERVGEWTFRLGSKASYARYVEFGSHLTPARRFLSRALELSTPSLVQQVDQAVTKSISETTAT